MSILSTRLAIKNKLLSMQSIHSVYDYERGEPTGYPYVTISITNGSQEFGDSAGSESGRNIHNAEYVVKVYQEREENLFGTEKAERVSIEVLDELLTAFNNDTTLSGAVLWQLPKSWTATYEQKDKVVRVLEVTLEVVEVLTAK